jgi:hypothetical protein
VRTLLLVARSATVFDLGGLVRPAAWIPQDLEMNPDEVENSLQCRRIDGRWFVTPRPYLTPEER